MGCDVSHTPIIRLSRTCDMLRLVVNTFLPFPSFTRSARVLDGARLNKQRLEVTWILKALNGAKGYSRHPATRMWAGHEFALISYGLHVHDELTRRKVPDREDLEGLMCDFAPFSRVDGLRLTPRQLKEKGWLPWWFGWRRFHQSHRSNLFRKDPNHYMNFHDYEGVGPDLPYIWPREQPYHWMEKHAGKEFKGIEYSSTPPPTSG